MERAILHSDLNCFYASVETMVKEKVQDVVEEIRGRFGKAAVTYASLLGDLKMPTDGRGKVKMPGIMYQ